MQTGIVAVRVDYGRLIIEWLIVTIVTFVVMLLIFGLRVGVKPVSSAAAPVVTDIRPLGTPPEMPEPDETARGRYLFACFLFGVAILVLTGLYPPWVGLPLRDGERTFAELSNGESRRLTLIPAGYGWLWQSYRGREPQPTK